MGRTSSTTSSLLGRRGRRTRRRRVFLGPRLPTSSAMKTCQKRSRTSRSLKRRLVLRHLFCPFPSTTHDTTPTPAHLRGRSDPEDDTPVSRRGCPGFGGSVVGSAVTRAHRCFPLFGCSLVSRTTTATAGCTSSSTSRSSSVPPTAIS